VSGENTVVSRPIVSTVVAPGKVEAVVRAEPVAAPTISPGVGAPGPVGPQGPQGQAGATGPQGERGLQGDPGPQGIQGPIGSVGPAGAVGPAGPAGAKGDRGDVGPAGPQGPQGPQGDRGLQGDPGPQGIQGPIGSVGPAGAVGSAGPAGAKGDRGDVGPAGPQGPAGAAGAVGPQGPQGDRGLQGIQGPAGDVGPAGPRGAQGEQGIPGDRGPSGADGAAGPQGPAGVAGPAGPQGPAGATGPAGTTSWSGITDVPSTFPPSAHTHTISDVSGLQTALDGKQATGSYVLTTDSRLSDAREWSAATVTQADAEAGAATARVAWTVQRVWQAIAAWWAASSAKLKLDGIATGATANASDSYLLSRANHTGTQAASTISGLATVATTGAYADLSGTPAAYALPIATSSTLGGVKQGSNVTIDAAGVISVAAPVTSLAWTAITERPTFATVATSGSYNDLSDKPSIPAAYNLPAATTSTLGGIIVSTGLAVTSGTVTVSYGTAAGTACQGNDTRLSDARTPTAHAHGNITSDGAIGTTASRIVVTTTSGVLTVATLGSGLSLVDGVLSSTGGGGGSSSIGAYAASRIFR